MEQIGEFAIASSKTLDTFIPHQDNTMPQDVYSFIRYLNMQDLPVSFPSWPGILHGNDTQRSCICLNFEATCKHQI